MFSEGTVSDLADIAVFFSAHMLSKSRVIVPMAASIIGNSARLVSMVAYKKHC
jgi:hypothetical protein